MMCYECFLFSAKFTYDNVMNDDYGLVCMQFYFKGVLPGYEKLNRVKASLQPIHPNMTSISSISNSIKSTNVTLLDKEIGKPC